MRPAPAVSPCFTSRRGKREAKHTPVAGRSYVRLSVCVHGAKSWCIVWLWKERAVQGFPFPITAFHARERERETQPNGRRSLKIVFGPSTIYMYLYRTSLAVLGSSAICLANPLAVDLSKGGGWCVAGESQELIGGGLRRQWANFFFFPLFFSEDKVGWGAPREANIFSGLRQRSENTLVMLMYIRSEPGKYQDCLTVAERRLADVGVCVGSEGLTVLLCQSGATFISLP